MSGSSVVDVQSVSESRIRALRLECQRLLATLNPDQIEWPGPNGMKVGDLIGLLLIDLDRLSSSNRTADSGPAPFALEFMDRRLARKLAAKYSGDAVAREVERRFVAALAAGEIARDTMFARLLTRLEHRLADLAAALKADRVR